jgi:hypothetical protein
MLTLFGTVGCHPCQVLAEQIAASGVEWRYQDVTDLPEWTGKPTPVVELPDGRRLVTPSAATLAGELVQAPVVVRMPTWLWWGCGAAGAWVAWKLYVDLSRGARLEMSERRWAR